MDIRKLILRRINKNKTIKAADIVKATRFSRVYINRFFKELRDEGRIILIGKANKARYVLAEKRAVEKIKKDILTVHLILRNKNLSEDVVLDKLKQDAGIFSGLSHNISDLLDYAFTEMLNNAIEHSNSRKIEINMKRRAGNIRFDIRDWGVGIFNHISKKKKLNNELEAIQDLIKGKLTTLPKEHTGEGIFFTSKAADMLTIQSSKKKLTFNNILDDIFIENIKETKGTKVNFIVKENSKKQLNKIFREFSDNSYEFSKTKVIINLYGGGANYISRSQARRVISGLDKFKIVIIDFKNVGTVGQGFADEIFRVWQNRHPNIKIICQNANENIDFMIKKALGG